MRNEKEIGKIVKSLRGDLSLRQFAQKCGVSHTTIDTIERGEDFRTGKPAQVKLATLQKISQACGVQISYITGEDSESLDPAAKQLIEIIENLSPDQVEQLNGYANYLLSQKKQSVGKTSDDSNNYKRRNLRN